VRLSNADSRYTEIEGMAWDPSRHRMYGIGAATGSPLYSINLRTGQTTFVGNTGLGTPRALTFRDGVLWVVDTGDDDLYQINPDNGARTHIAPVGTGASTVSGLTFCANALYAINGANLWTLNPATGAITTTHGTRSGIDDIMCNVLQSPSTSLFAVNGSHFFQIDLNGTMIGTDHDLGVSGFNALAFGP